MRKIVLIFLCLAFTSGAFAVEISTYTVVKGDTLWNLAGKFYDNSWHWPKIFEANRPAVSDPNMIFPEQVLNIPDKSAPCPPVPTYLNPPEEQVAAEAAAKTAAEAPVVEKAPAEPAIPAVTETPAEPPETITVAAIPEAVPETQAAEAAEPEPEPAAVKAPAEKSPQKQGGDYLEANKQIVSVHWVPDGYITAGEEEKLMISAGDTVYVNIGRYDTKPGARYTIYRKLGKIKDPKERKYLGYEIMKVGVLEITNQISSDAAAARILVSYDPIKTGDSVKAVEKSNE